MSGLRARLASGLVPAALVIAGCSTLSGLSDYRMGAAATDGGARDGGIQCPKVVEGSAVWTDQELPGRGHELEPLQGVIADADLDGAADLIFTNQLSENATVFYGHGDGTFETLVNYSMRLPGGAVAVRPGPTQGPALGDLDRDGVLDLVVTANGDLYQLNRSVPPGLFVLPGRAPRGFKVPVAFEQFERPESVALVDANRDGLLDVLVSLTRSPYCTALRLNQSTGPGVFAFGDAICLGAPPFHSFARFDVEGDGVDELLVTSGDVYDRRIELARFASDSRSVTLASLPIPKFVQIAHVIPAKLDDDAFGDFYVVGARASESELYAFHGRGDGTFDECRLATQVPYFLSGGDVNGDGKLDLMRTEGPAAGQFRFFLAIQR